MEQKFERWLKQAYKYYIEFDNDMSDFEWDAIGRELKENWNSWDHPDKGVVKQDEMFSLYYLKSGDYPSWAKS